MRRLFSKTLNIANNVISVFDLEIRRIQNDYDYFLDNKKQQDIMCKLLSRQFDEWALAQTTFRTLTRFSTFETVSSFFTEYMSSPYRQRNGGSRFNNLLWLHLLAKSVQPEIIVDSGTFRGASAWALSSGATAAAVYSFDPDLSHVLRREPNVIYRDVDWMDVDLPRSRSLMCYFDDHLDQVNRLLQAKDRNALYAIFDDDYPVSACAGQLPGAWSLPKLEFAFDESLEHGEVLRWQNMNRSIEWVVDTEYLKKAYDCIAHTERLPNTSLLNGIHQTPYRVVRLTSS